MHLQDLSEDERRVIELYRLLKNSDQAFQHLPTVHADRMKIMLDRGHRYNGSSSSLASQIFYMGDQSAFHRTFDPINRCKQPVTSGKPNIPDSEIRDLIEDTANYTDIWMCLRNARSKSGA